MDRPRECDGCRQGHTCQEAYRQLGNRKGPPVSFTACVAFVLPVLAFVAALGGFGHLAESLVAPPYQTPLTLVLALSATAALMFVVHLFLRPPRQKGYSETD
jgi:hypothetical protein